LPRCRSNRAARRLTSHGAPDRSKKDRSKKEKVVARFALTIIALAATLAATAASAQAPRDPSAPLALPEPIQAKEGLAVLPDTRLWYWDTGGDGAPIVLVHPATGSALIWGYQAPVFAKAGYRVIGYSRRSYYNSDPIVADRPGIASEDLHHLADYLGLKKFHLIGSAAGGGIAADYGVSHPDRLLSLIVASNPSGLSSGPIAMLYEDLRPKEFPGLPPDFRELGPSYRASNPAGAKLWLELEHKAITSRPFRQPAANKITEATLNRLQVPTLLISGEADLASPPGLIRKVAAQIPGSELVTVPEGGHSTYWERPDLFNRAVLDFVGRHSK
jgi:pimeloyl-ACP methyl ester carboxylesterase